MLTRDKNCAKETRTRSVSITWAAMNHTDDQPALVVQVSGLSGRHNPLIDRLVPLAVCARKGVGHYGFITI